MKRRDYLFLAECFRRTLDTDTTMTREERRGVKRAARDMAHEIARDNPKFDQIMFLQNAGVIDTSQLKLDETESYGGSS